MSSILFTNCIWDQNKPCVRLRSSLRQAQCTKPSSLKAYEPPAPLSPVGYIYMHLILFFYIENLST